jgi:hypothetical protein
MFLKMPAHMWAFGIIAKGAIYLYMIGRTILRARCPIPYSIIITKLLELHLADFWVLVKFLFYTFFYPHLHQIPFSIH